ncbi:MAG: inverse autotransporter beta domain-containing protein [Chlamydiales bacterium]|nr:inverse autotransporter beta domain-containing protein [Chlamydiales bacterium]
MIKYVAALLWVTTLFSSELVMKHREHNGVGYDTGYTTLSTFLLPDQNKPIYPMFDGRFHIFDDGKFAANLGGGLRMPFGNPDWALGANFFYDYRDDGAFQINQVGPGLELLNPFLDFRLNGYIPLKSTKFKSDNTTFLHFQGHQAIVKNSLRAALPCVEGEIGSRYINKNVPLELYGSLGSYYLFSNKVDRTNFGRAWGGTASATLEIMDRFFAGIDVTYDRIFRWTVQGVAGINLLPKPKQIPRFLSQPIMRNEIIPIQKRVQRAPLINPATHEPFNFVFVNNQSGSNGTFEDPYPTLLEAQAASNPRDIIYLYPGDGTTTGYDAGYKMRAWQVLQGSGTDLPLAGTVIPAQTPGQMPIMTNLAGNGVTLEDFNIIRGIHVNGASINNITDGGVAGSYLIEYCRIANSQLFAIDGTAALGTIFTLTGSKIVRNNEFYGNGISGGGQDSDVVILAAPNSVVRIQDNYMDGQGITSSGVLSVVLGDVDMRVERNFSTGMLNIDAAIQRYNQGDNAFILVSQNQFVSSCNSGFTFFPLIPISLINGPGELRIEQNIFDNHTFSHIGIQVDTFSEITCSLNQMLNLTPSNVQINLTPLASQICLTLEYNNNPGSYTFLNQTGDPEKYQVQAPNASLSGLETQNTGTFIISPAGTTNFVQPGTPCP